jgi:hypothetical protein
MNSNICYLFIKKNNSPDDQKQILSFARECSSIPKECFVKTACHVYKSHYDFIFIVEAFGWSYALNNYFVVCVPNGNMTALCLKFHDRVLLQLIVPSNVFITPEISLKAYEIRKARYINNGYESIESNREELRNQLRSSLDNLCN